MSKDLAALRRIISRRRHIAVWVLFCIAAGFLMGADDERTLSALEFRSFYNPDIDGSIRILAPGLPDSIATKLDLKWPEPSASPSSLNNILANGILSLNSEYCLILLGRGRSPHRKVYLVQSTGRVHWESETRVEQVPCISDNGVTAFVRVIPENAPSDSTRVHVEFVNKSGKEIGLWTAPRSKFGFAFRGSDESFGTFRFVPNMDNLIVLNTSVDTGRVGAKYLWSIGPCGKTLWSHEIPASVVNRITFSGDGQHVIVFGKKAIRDESGNERACSLVALVYDLNGHKIDNLAKEIFGIVEFELGQGLKRVEEVLYGGSSN